MRYIIDNFKPEPGWHCNTTSLKQIFHYFNHNFSEEMLFGLACGLDFMYFNYKNMPIPFIGGRTDLNKFEDSLAENLNIEIQINATSSPKKAYNELRSLIINDIPVMIYVDMQYLDYLKLPKEAHFGGHSIVVFGIDEEKGTAYISDRDMKDFPISPDKKIVPDDFHIITLDALQIARNSNYKPFPPKNKYLTFNFKGIRKINKGVIFGAVRKNAVSMLNPPIKNLGVKGIKLLSEKIIEWKSFSEEKLKTAAHVTNIMLSPEGGSGKGNFRGMYGNFLLECSEILKSSLIQNTGDKYLLLSEKWDNVSKDFRKISDTGSILILDSIFEKLESIYKDEKYQMEEILKITK